MSRNRLGGHERRRHARRKGYAAAPLAPAAPSRSCPGVRMRTPAAFAAARPFIKRQRPATAASDTAPPPEPVAAISAPVLSSSSGFS